MQARKGWHPTQGRHLWRTQSIWSGCPDSSSVKGLVSASHGGWTAVGHTLHPLHTLILGMHCVLGLIFVFLFFKMIHWSPSSHCGGIWRWDLWEVTSCNEDEMFMGQHSYEKRKRHQSLLSPPCGHSEKVAVCKPKREPSPGMQSAHTLIWDPSSRTVRSKCLLVKPLSLWCFVLTAQINWDTPVILEVSTKWHPGQSSCSPLSGSYDGQCNGCTWFSTPWQASHIQHNLLSCRQQCSRKGHVVSYAWSGASVHTNCWHFPCTMNFLKFLFLCDYFWNKPDFIHSEDSEQRNKLRWWLVLLITFWSIKNI